MTEDIRNKVLDRARKLYALAQDGAATQGEVTNAMAALKRLMDAHDVNEAEIADAVREPDAAISQRESNLKDKGWGIWREYLAGGVAAVCNCRVCYRRYDTGKKAVFYGFESCVAVATELFALLVETVKTMARATYGPGWRTSHQSYAAGFGLGVRAQADALRQEREREAKGSTALVLIKKDELVTTWASEHLSLRKARRHSPQFNADAVNKGLADGRRVSVGTATIR